MWSEIYPQFQRWGNWKISITLIPMISKISARKKETEDLILDDLILDSPLETENLHNFEKAGDQLALPEQLVIGENESSENTELGGEEDPSMHEGSEIAPSELIEFDNNLIRVEKFFGGKVMKKRMF